MKKLALFAVMFALNPAAHAVVLVVDYTYDSGNFFSGNLAAKSAVEAAALDISNVITSSLGPVTTDVYSSTNGGTTATFNWSVNFNNPTTNAPETLATFSAAANEIRLFVGMRQLSGGIEVRSSHTPESAHASTLGVGGPAGVELSIGASSSGNSATEWVGAVAVAESLSNAAMLRGGGPVIGTLNDSMTFGATANYSLGYGALFGTLSMDIDTAWHYDHTTAVGVGENDFYSVALHEMLHAIGIGTSETWNTKTSGTSWTGTNVINLMGNGLGLISPGGDHIADGIMSTRISDGLAQETVMDPTITEGTRKTLTALDLAFLQDLGFTTVAVPEPSRVLLLLFGAGGVLLTRRRQFMPV
jgi:hypothetical protein